MTTLDPRGPRGCANRRKFGLNPDNFRGHAPFHSSESGRLCQNRAGARAIRRRAPRKDPAWRRPQLRNRVLTARRFDTKGPRGDAPAH
jgi:hypothetical protein